MIEVDRNVDGNGNADLGGHKVKVGAGPGRPPGHAASRRAPHPRHARRGTGPDPALPGPRRRPRQAPRRPHRRHRAAAPRTRPGQRPAEGPQRRRHHGHPPEDCASAPPTPGRSSPSTSRTPTSASPATAPRYPCTPEPSNAPSPGGKPRSTPPGPEPRPASPETVNQVLSRNCQASPETTHDTRAASGWFGPHHVTRSTMARSRRNRRSGGPCQALVSSAGSRHARCGTPLLYRAFSFRIRPMSWAW